MTARCVRVPYGAVLGGGVVRRQHKTLCCVAVHARKLAYNNSVRTFVFSCTCPLLFPPAHSPSLCHAMLLPTLPHSTRTRRTSFSMLLHEHPPSATQQHSHATRLEVTAEIRTNSTPSSHGTIRVNHYSVTRSCALAHTLSRHHEHNIPLQSHTRHHSLQRCTSIVCLLHKLWQLHTVLTLSLV